MKLFRGLIMFGLAISIICCASNKGDVRKEASDYAQPDPVVDTVGALRSQVVFEEPHEMVDFRRRPPPVVAGKGV